MTSFYDATHNAPPSHRYRCYYNGKLIAITNFPWRDGSVKWHKARGHDVQIIDKEAKP